MTTHKFSEKMRLYLHILLTAIGCVLAVCTIIPNDYVKLIVVMSALCVGMYGIMRHLGQPTTD